MAKGLGASAAIEHGLNIWQGKEDAVSASPRFAAIYGDGSTDNPADPGDSGQSDQGFEGVETEAYLDAVGVPTICSGLTRYPNGAPVRMGDVCNEVCLRPVSRGHAEE